MFINYSNNKLFFRDRGADYAGASKAFVAEDLTDQLYLCFLCPETSQLKMIKFVRTSVPSNQGYLLTYMIVSFLQVIAV